MSSLRTSPGTALRALPSLPTSRLSALAHTRTCISPETHTRTHLCPRHLVAVPHTRGRADGEPAPPDPLEPCLLHNPRAQPIVRLHQELKIVRAEHLFELCGLALRCSRKHAGSCDAHSGPANSRRLPHCIGWAVMWMWVRAMRTCWERRDLLRLASN